MSETSADLRIPRLAVGCRVRKVSEEEVMLLVPEGALQLKGAANEIISLVDGVRSVAAVTALLQERHLSDDACKIAVEVKQFLEKLHARSVLLFME